MIIKRKPKAEAFFQIILLIVGVVAISYAIGSSVGVVSAEGDNCVEGVKRCSLGNTLECINGKEEIIIVGSCELDSSLDYDFPSRSNVNTPINPNLQIDDKSGLGLQELSGWAQTTIQGYSLAKRITAPKLGLTPAEIAAAADAEITTTLTAEQIAAAKVTEEAAKAKIAADIAAIAPTWGRFIWTTAAWATAIYVGIRFIGSKITDDVNIQRGFNTKVAAEVAKGVAVEAAKLSVMEGLGPLVGFMAMPGFGWIMAGAGIIISLLLFKNERYQQITYQCNAWQPQTGGDDCELCNNQGLLPCTDYQCRSLGQGCELINQGTGNEKCVWVNPNDIKYPIIETWDDALLNEKYRYSPTDAIAPPDRGAFIKYQSSDGCVPAFTP